MNFSTSCSLNLANTTCLEHGVCSPVNSTLSKCICNSGYRGPNCEIIRPLEWVYIFDGIFYLLLWATVAFLCFRHFRKTHGKELEAAVLRGITPSRSFINSKFIVAFRFIVFTVFLGIHLGGWNPTMYKFYTVWNFILMIMYFGLGLCVSLFTEFKGHQALTESVFWGSVAKIHYIFLEIELPNAFLVDGVTWMILYPTCGSVACPGLVNYNSFFQHLINVFAILGDFALSSHAFDPRHFFFVLAWPTLYATFHLFFTLANDVNGHQPVYFFLNASDPIQPAWIIGVMFLTLGVFFAVWAVSSFCLKRKLPTNYLENDGVVQIHDQADTQTKGEGLGEKV